jgi:hypothetical protein
MRKFLIGLAAAVVLMLSPTQSSAQQFCSDRAEFVKFLGDQHQEFKIARGLASSGFVIEIFAKADWSTWTLIGTNVQGISCLLLDGEIWDNQPDAKDEPEGTKKPT